MSAGPELRSLPFAEVGIEGGFWGPRLAVNRRTTLRTEYKQLKETRRIDAWKLDWQPGMPHEPHVFWDSDVAKWIEAAAYAIEVGPDPELEARVEGVIDLIAAAQQPDGYLNVHFTVVEPEKRWTNLRDQHELYCAGHMMEAAVAWFHATGKRTLLEVMCRYADLIDATFGPNKGQMRGYPGHEEIELALVKLYRCTREQRYLQLAEFFINERGRQPHYFDREAAKRGEEPGRYWASGYDYCQAHLPVREQETAEGHAVRAMYLYSGMADVAAETGDRSLMRACRKLWRNVTERRMYVTGGIGSTQHGERFTRDFDLPNETAYAETCAAIGLVFWAHRMLQNTADARYADVLERALYNGVLSGVSLDGEKFFYANPLAIDPEALGAAGGHVSAVRQEWFGCACCPPNIARLLASLPSYAYSIAGRRLYVHLYAQSGAALKVSGKPVRLRQQTRYPWRDSVRIDVSPPGPVRFTLALRLPGWCRQPRIAVNGEDIELEPVTKKGYAHLKREWHPGDRVELELPMPVERVYADPRVRHDVGRVALQRGPVVYCLEETDNGSDLNAVVLPRKAKLKAVHKKDLLGGVTVIRGRAKRELPHGKGSGLYTETAPRTESASITAVPYYAWCNREPGEMLVWIREC